MDKIFNRAFETVYGEDGQEIVRFDSTSIANIPEMIRHWRQDIDKRKKRNSRV